MPDIFNKIYKPFLKLMKEEFKHYKNKILSVSSIILA